jgi:hypothetical protein
MVQRKSLPFPMEHGSHQISLEKFSEEHIVATDFQSDDILEKLLCLPDGQTFLNFKNAQRALFKKQQSTKGFPAYLTAACDIAFGKPYQTLLTEKKSLLRQQFILASATQNREARLSELHACSKQGHIQAMLELGRSYAASLDVKCVRYFIDAHNAGHPDGLLYLAQPYLQKRDFAPGIRALLAGAWCGSIRCADLLIQMTTMLQHAFLPSESRLVIEEAVEYGSVHAQYVLGFLLRHGDQSYQDEARGRSLIKTVAETKHFRSDDGRGPFVVVDGVEKPVAGSLSHLEWLIDRELLNIRQLEFDPKFEEFMAERKSQPNRASAKEEFDELFELLCQNNPMSDRMVRRTAAWLEEGKTAPADPKKLEMMKTMFTINEVKSTKGEADEPK